MFCVQGRVSGLWLWPGAKQVLVRLSPSLDLMSRCQWPVTTPWARIRAVSGGWVQCQCHWCLANNFCIYFSTFLLWMRGFASVSMPPPLSILLPIIWSILEYCLSSYIGECWHNLSSDSLVSELLFMMKYLHLWPVDNVSDSRGLTPRLRRWAASRRSQTEPVLHYISSLHWLVSDEMLAGIGGDLSWDTSLLRAGPHGLLGKQTIVPKLSLWPLH